MSANQIAANKQIAELRAERQTYVGKLTEAKARLAEADKRIAELARENAELHAAEGVFWKRKAEALAAERNEANAKIERLVETLEGLLASETYAVSAAYSSARDKARAALASIKGDGK